MYTVCAAILIAGITQAPVQDPVRPESPKLLAIFSRKPAKIETSDDELRKLLKHRFNVSIETLQRMQERIQGAVWKGLEEQSGLVEATKSLVRVGLELYQEPAERIELMTQLLEVAVRYEKLAEARKDVDNPTMLPQARGWRLDVEIDLLREQIRARQPLRERQ